MERLLGFWKWGEINCFKKVVLSYFLRQLVLTVIPIPVTGRREEDI